MNGIIDHGIVSKPLEKISEKFAKIDAVPSGYFYHEIYASKRPLNHALEHEQKAKLWKS